MQTEQLLEVPFAILNVLSVLGVLSAVFGISELDSVEIKICFVFSRNIYPAVNSPYQLNLNDS